MSMGSFGLKEKQVIIMIKVTKKELEINITLKLYIQTEAQKHMYESCKQACLLYHFFKYKNL